MFGRLALGFFLTLLIGCRPEQTRTSAIAEAFAGPSTLTLHQDLSPKSPPVATAKHGDRLDVLEYRRRFVRVRTAEGKEGWTDVRQLLTPEQMADLRQSTESAKHLPSQGAATAFETLNIHTEPNRASPSFLQLPENGKVDVIGHKLSPRAQATPTTPVKIVKPRPSRRHAKEKQGESRISTPPPPAAPKAPKDWLALSVPNSKSLEKPNPEALKGNEPPPPPAPVHMDDWSLVRTKDGQAGWVLMRMLSMAIPDEVAQYAEGHRITSYFALSQVQDGAVTKNNWLWTTITKGQEPYEFDSFRVFIWSHNHHRYETSYIDRNIIGHFPVRVDTSGPAPRFSLLVEGVDGHLYRKNYMLDGNRVRLIDRVQADQADQKQTSANPVASVASPGEAKEESWLSKMKQGVSKLFR
jgi:hypothetical protein